MKRTQFITNLNIKSCNSNSGYDCFFTRKNNNTKPSFACGHVFCSCKYCMREFNLYSINSNETKFKIELSDNTIRALSK